MKDLIDIAVNESNRMQFVAMYDGKARPCQTCDVAGINFASNYAVQLGYIVIVLHRLYLQLTVSAITRAFRFLLHHQLPIA